MEKWSDSELEKLWGNVGSFDPGETIGEDYEVIKFLDKGGQAEVYKVRNKNDGNYYVAKIFVDDEENQRFEDECRVFNILKDLLPHPNIVHAHPATIINGHKILILGYVQGPKLEEYFKQHSYSPWRALKIMPKVLDGLALLHLHGIVHRDIKPGNIKLANECKRPVIFDFSISLLVKHDSNEATPYAGTPGYSPPEKEVTPAWDVFSAGVMLHKLCTGRLPIWECGGSKPDSSSDRLVIPRELAFRPALAYCLYKSLAFNPKKRYRSAKEFSNAISFKKIPLNLILIPFRWIRYYPLKSVACVAIILLTSIGLHYYTSSMQRYYEGIIESQNADIKERKERLVQLSRIEVAEVWNEFKTEFLLYSLNTDAVIGKLDNLETWIEEHEKYSMVGADTLEILLNMRDDERKRWNDIAIQLKGGLDIQIDKIQLFIPEVEDIQRDTLIISLKVDEEEKEVFELRRHPEMSTYFSYRGQKTISQWKTNSKVQFSLKKPRRIRRPIILIQDFLKQDSTLYDMQPLNKNDYRWIWHECLEGKLYAVQFSGRIIPP